MLIMSMKSPYKSLGGDRRREKGQNHKELMKPRCFHGQTQIYQKLKQHSYVIGILKVQIPQ